MATGKLRAKKKRIGSAHKSSIAGPVWAILKKFGKRRTHRWRLNPHMRRKWRSSKLKA
jgi:ribosomal protein L39E